MFDVSEDMYEKRLKAVKVFTDREEPQEAFERKYRVLCANIKKSYYVLCYYGIGGVGKTSFIEKLCRIIDKVPCNNCRIVDDLDCYYIKHSFENESVGKDVITILLNLRRKLGNANRKFGFYRFDAALVSYAKREGIDISVDKENACIIENNPWLKTIFTLGGLTPVGWVFNVVQAIDTVSEIAREHLKHHMQAENYKMHLEYVSGLETGMLLKEMPNFFIQDMRDNMLHVAEKPLIIFLDAYERYINSFDEDGIKGTKDYWLRKGHARSVIRSIPGILWVITGREKLRWNEDDDWGDQSTEKLLDELSEEDKNILAEQHLEQHLIGDLSFKDSCSFLQTAGICDAELQRQLFRLTNGTPLFLDLSVDLYYEIINNGGTPVLADFGNTYSELIVRYMERLPLYARELICFFSCIGKWTHEYLEEILLRTNPPIDYWERRYEDFLTHSFVVKNSNSEYCIHETVRKAAYKFASAKMKRSIRLAILETYEERCAKKKHIIDFSEEFLTYISNLYAYDASPAEIIQKQELVLNELRQIEQRGNYQTFFTAAKYIVAGNKRLIGEKHPYTISAIANLANAYSHIGNKAGALNLKKQVYSARKATLGDNDIQTLQAQHALGIGYYEMGHIQEALETREAVYTKSCSLLGENAAATLSSLHALALSYHSVGDYERALAIREHVYKKRIAILGQDHSDTLWTLHNLAISYSKVGKKVEAFEIRKKVYQKRRVLLSKNHPDTLWSYYALADSYSELGEVNKAFEIRKEIHACRRQILGENHPDTLTSLYSISKSFLELGDLSQALNCMLCVFNGRRAVLGESHPDTQKAHQYILEIQNKTAN